MTLAHVRGAVAAVVMSAAALPGQSASKTRPLSYTKFTLPNGLVTIVNEDHSSPIVGINLMYHVGSKDEQPGHQQMAHTCEHLMFEGSPHVRGNAEAFYTSIGGTSSPGWGLTSEDQTTFVETVPSNYLETALWFEADRMAAPAFRSDSQTLVLARNKIANERAQSRTGPLWGTAKEAIIRALFPKGHPYSWEPGDPLPSLDQTSPQEVHAFCAAHYVPSNAFLGISGDVNPQQVKKWVEKYFGPIPRGSAPHARVPASALTAETRVVQEDPRARVAAIHFVWHGASFSNPDKMALQALAFILVGDRRSGLQKALRYDHRLASSVDAVQADLESAGIFDLWVYALPTGSLTAIEQVVDSVVAAARDTPPSANLLADFQSSDRLTAARWLALRINRADTLTEGEGFGGDPLYYAKDIARADHLQPSDVQRVARKYLTDRRVVLSLVPAGKLEMVSKPERPYTRLDNAGFPIPAPSGERHEIKSR